ncbi:MAG: shikimate kinase [Fulvivirga sp.]|uniref:shikimate kinase n=1 Tax=Fulvivirga sp. TaxID=1931237 RepID=UPI0032EECC48
MNLPDKIILIGMPGSGKTTLGKEVADYLNLPFYDLDQVIELASGMTILQIFETEGEESFRNLEAETLKKFCQTQDKYVLAAGGGTPCFFNNMEIMNQAAITVFLDISIAALAKRMNQSAIEKRPLFQKEDINTTLESLLSQRRANYEQARFHLVSDELFAEDIRDVLKKEPNRK